MPENGCVIFAKDIQTMSVFYQSVLNMKPVEEEKSHHVLSNGVIELVIHGIPKKIADIISIKTPPDIREATAIKPAFVVESLEHVRRACEETNGGIKPVENTWTIRGAQVIDGWDPEGNVIQFKQFSR